MTGTDQDRALATLLRGTDRAPDEAFVARMRQAVLAEQRIARARAAAWRQFYVEGAGCLAIVAALMLLGRAAPAMNAATFGPASAAALTVLFWLAIGMRPATGRRGA